MNECQVPEILFCEQEIPQITILLRRNSNRTSRFFFLIPILPRPDPLSLVKLFVWKYFISLVLAVTNHWPPSPLPPQSVTNYLNDSLWRIFQNLQPPSSTSPSCCSFRWCHSNWISLINQIYFPLVLNGNSFFMEAFLNVFQSIHEHRFRERKLKRSSFCACSFCCRCDETLMFNAS